jgi:F-box domain
MAGLPSELWTLILEHVARPDLKSCRLVNRRICNLASTPLFSKIYASPTYDGFSRAINISTCPSLSEYVRTLVYRVDHQQDQPYRFRPEHSEHLRQWLGPDDHGLIVEQQHPIVHGWNADIHRQQILRQQGAEGHELQRILTRLPNLTYIEIRCSNRRCAWNSNHPGFLKELQYNSQPVTGRLLLILLILTRNSQSSIISLTCDYLDWSIFERVASLSVPVYPLLSSLRHLNLYFSLMYGSLLLTGLDQANNVLEQFFHATSHLETLILDSNIYDYYDLADGAVGLGNAILSSVQRLRLKTFSLAGFLLGENELLEFLRNQPNLRNLRLYYVGLCPGSTISLIHGLHEYVCLHNLCFHGVYDDRMLDDPCPAWEGSCIGSRGTADGFDNVALASTSPPQEEELEVRCAGYRSEKWFGGDDSWCECEGTPVDEHLSSMLGPLKRSS